MSLPCLLQGRHRRHCLLRQGSRKVCLPPSCEIGWVASLQLLGRSFPPFSCFCRLLIWGCQCCLWRLIPSSLTMCGRLSSDLWHIDKFDVLLVAIKKLEVSSSGREVASSGNHGTVLLQPLVRRSCVEGLLLTPTTKTTKRHPCLDQIVIVLFCEGAFVRVAM